MNLTRWIEWDNLARRDAPLRGRLGALRLRDGPPRPPPQGAQFVSAAMRAMMAAKGESDAGD